MISVVACCHSAKLCAHAARDFRWQQAQPLDKSISLKFLVETRLESESFQLLINILAFQVQHLRFKINKLIIYLIDSLIKCFLYFR